MPPLESEPDGHYGKWKMEDCNLGSAGCQPASFGSLPKHTNDAGNPGPNPSAWRAPLCRRPKIWDTTARVPPGSKTEKEMPDRASLAIRHLVDVQLAAAKTELCVTVVFFELWGAFALQSLYGMSHWMIN